MNPYNPRVFATALCLAFGIAGTNAFPQPQTQTSPPTDAFGANAGAQFAEPALSNLSTEPIGDDPRARILRWNEIAMDCTALDHTPPPSGDPRVFREQFGPGREAKALAIVHIAIFDAVNAVTGNHFRSYTGLPAVQRPTGLNVAIAQAAHDTIVNLWPAQTAKLDGLLAADLDEFPDGDLKSRGIALGRRAAAAILARRVDDGSAHGRSRRGRRLHSRHRSGRMAAGSGQPDPDRPGREVGRGETVRPALGEPVPPAASTRPHQRAVHARVQRSEAPGRRRPHHADGAHPGPDHRRHLLGLRRNAQPQRPAAAVQPDRGPHRQPAGHGHGERRQSCSPARPRAHVDGRRRHRLLGIEVRLQVLASRRRHPRRRHRRESQHHRRSRSSRRWALPPATSSPA